MTALSLRTMMLLVAAWPALAQDPDAITVVERRALALEQVAVSPSHRLHLTLAYLQGSGWSPESVLSATREAAAILGQCGLTTPLIDLVRIGAPPRYLHFSTPISRLLSAALPLAKPVVYFVSETRQRPAFDAEAIGRSNSRTRPELADTVWVTRGTRNPGIAVAHELAHVLMDSGEHSDAPGNLMRDDTAPANISLSYEQCALLRDTATRNGLIARLQP